MPEAYRLTRVIRRKSKAGRHLRVAARFVISQLCYWPTVFWACFVVGLGVNSLGKQCELGGYAKCERTQSAASDTVTGRHPFAIHSRT